MLRYLVAKKGKSLKEKKLNYKSINFKRIKNYSGAIDSSIENRKFFYKN